MISILPFEKEHQSGIEDLMNGIQEEFDLPFRNPNSVSVSEYVESGNFFWVALHENQVVGTIALSRFGDHTGVLRNLFVSKEHRGTHAAIAKSLLDTALDKAKNLGYSAIYLGTMDQFKAAQKFYSKNKFVQIPKADLPDTMSFNPVDTLFYVLRNKSELSKYDNMKVRLILLLFLILCGKLFGQIKTADASENKFYSAISCNSKIFVSEQIVKWEVSDYYHLNQIEKEVSKKDSSKSFSKPLKQLLDNELMTLGVEPKLDLNKYEFWSKEDFPENFQIINRKKFKRKVKTLPVELKFRLSDYCALSKPFYNSARNMVVIKLDFSFFHLIDKSNGCHYLLYEFKNNEWVVLQASGN